MGSDLGSSQHPADWVRQREQLSAYVDGELSAAERAAIERHLPACAECRAELAELRRVRALLGALPAPTLPRSFALPTGSSTNARLPNASSRANTGSGRPPWYRASQWAGGVAASLGLALLLGNALLGQASPTFRMAASAPQAGSAQSSRTTQDTQQTPGSVTAPSTTNTPPAIRPATTPTPKAVIMPGSQPPVGENEPPILPLTGTGLFIGGVALLVAGRVSRRRTTIRP
jgi:anti-sigma factor RsiW